MAETQQQQQQGITIQVTLAEPLTDDDNAKATLVLYLHDKRLADAPAALVSKTSVAIPAGVTTVTAFLPNDETAKQIGKAPSEMIQPAYYVGLDMAETVGVTYAASPAFGLQLGDTATLAVKRKST